MSEPMFTTKIDGMYIKKTEVVFLTQRSLGGWTKCDNIATVAYPPLRHVFCLI